MINWGSSCSSLPCREASNCPVRQCEVGGLGAGMHGGVEEVRSEMFMMTTTW